MIVKSLSRVFFLFFILRKGSALNCYQCAGGHESTCSSLHPEEIQASYCVPGRELAPLVLGWLPGAPAPLPGLLGAALAAVTAIVEPLQPQQQPRQVACLKLVTRWRTDNETIFRFCAPQSTAFRICEVAHTFAGNATANQANIRTGGGLFCGMCPQDSCNGAPSDVLPNLSVLLVTSILHFWLIEVK